MSVISAFLLLTTVIFSVLRNTMSKKISGCAFKTREFFFIQTLLFSSGSIILAGFYAFSPKNCSVNTLILGALYGLFLISAQWMYTSAMNEADISVCSVVYSMGFIFPTFSGKLFYNETITIGQCVGLLFALAVVIFSNINFKEKGKKTKLSTTVKMLAAMVSSGMLGVLQKVQQMSEWKSERITFLLIAFSFAAVISCSAFLFSKKEERKNGKANWFYGSAIGVCFVLANLLNTYLSGKLESAVFFPIQNIGVVLLTIISGIVFFREKVTVKTSVLFLLSCVSILLIAGCFQ